MRCISSCSLWTPSLQLGVLQSYHGSPVHIFLLHAPLFTPPSMNNLGSKYYEHCFSLRYWNLPLTPILAYVRCNKGWPLTMSMLSHKAVSGSSNPFCTPLRRSHVDSPPHLEPQRHNTQTQIVTHNMVTSSSSSDEEQPPAHIPTHHVCTPSPDVQYSIWQFDYQGENNGWHPSLACWLTVCLSLNVNNWLEWSCQLVMSLEMGQLDVYPLGLLNCPSHCSDRTNYCNWCRNDHMVLGFMWSHLFSSEAQCIAHCDTSMEAYWTLHWHHEECSGIMQIQLIQWMMQVCFNHSPINFDTAMANLWELIYRAKRIRQINVTKLPLLFTQWTSNQLTSLYVRP